MIKSLLQFSTNIKNKIKHFFQSLSLSFYSMNIPNPNPYNKLYSTDFFNRLADNQLDKPSIDNPISAQSNDKQDESIQIKHSNHNQFNDSKQVYELEFTIIYENEQRKPIGRIQEDKDESGKLICYHSFIKYEEKSQSNSGVYVLLSKDVNLESNKLYSMKGYLVRPKNSKYIVFEPINKQFFTTF